ncbi:hypothetical protein [Kribbella sp. VKM Ac-2569]|uniref:hypothetical protein n=1 Tax=Kribbella sp. VKM Ac-2569 TaxID=2512220 RepID=UPI001F540C30|nr:hypothetical protein [Kribbella sp. VKM Ac-2569]
MHLLVRRLTRLALLAVATLTVRRTGLRTLRTLRTAVLRAALLRTTVLLALLRSTVLRAAVLLALLRVTLLTRLRALLTLLGPEVLPLRVLTLRRTVLRLLTAGTWVRGWLVLVGHMLPRWLRWPHRRTCKG